MGADPPGESPDPRWLLFAVIGCYLVGYVGLLVAPHAGAIAWALLIGAGTTTFPLVLTLVGLRARTSEGTAALSGVTQSLGYLIAAADRSRSARCTTRPVAGRGHWSV